jgi:copper homeostasis protein CutC
MCEDIQVCGQLGVDGVVLGCLTPEGAVDVAAMGQLLQLTKSLVSGLTAAAEGAMYDYEPQLQINVISSSSSSSLHFRLRPACGLHE